MAKPPLNRKPSRIPPDGYDPDPPTPDRLADWAPIVDQLKVVETRFSYQRTDTNKDGVTTTHGLTAYRRTLSAMRSVGGLQLPPKHWKDALVGGVASVMTVVSLVKIVIAYVALTPVGTTDPVLAGAGLSMLAWMTIIGRRK